ncbi:MAG: ABC transporter permease [Clostridia bacterium]|nr:ABC transporter permease [Clostridia bacterium]MBQ9785193.1 ABC transporter permease [Clostridia bacterium]
MKQFGKILKFELKNYLQNKIFVGITLVLVAVLAVVMFFPRISTLFKSEENEGSDERATMLVVVNIDGADEELIGMVYNAFKAGFSDYDVLLSDLSVEEIKQEISAEKASCAFVLQELTSYTYYVDNLSMYDSNTALADELLQSVYRMKTMADLGLSADQIEQILAVPILHETENLGVDQMQNFFYTYIMIFALYMVILLYGQMVATNVATEKSSRAMELLITSADPVSMMFGKVLASCLAGLLQLVAVFGSALVFFNLNSDYWDQGGIMRSIFDMPVELFVYMLIFFVLGFLIYAFLFGAVGSTASKLEDINTSVMPITLLFVAGFLVVMLSMSSGEVDSMLMKVCSYVPFTSPMAMFTRIAMSTVPLYEILISIAILIASVVGVGVLSAKIYRMGVLMYGTPPKLGTILKALKKG